MRHHQFRSIVMLLVTAAVSSAGAGQLELGDRAPSLDVSAIKGRVPNVRAGNVTIVEFWATWCGPCKRTIPHLTEVQRHYGSRGVQIVGISDEDEDIVQPYVDEMGSKMGYAVALDNDRSAHSAYMDAFGITTIPHAFIVDQEGSIVWQGMPGGQEMLDVLNRLTAPNAPPRESAPTQSRPAGQDSPAAVSGVQKPMVINRVGSKSSSSGINFEWSEGKPEH